MEKLVIFRLFLCFPLFGFVLPDAGFLLANKPINVPHEHLVVEATLIFMISICSLLIFVKRKRDHNRDISNTPAY